MPFVDQNVSRYDDPEYRKQVANQMLATPTHEIACRAITDLRQRIEDLNRLYATVTGPSGDGGKYNHLMQQLEKRFLEGELTARNNHQISWFLKEIDAALDAKAELLQAKRQLLNIFTGGNLFPGESK